MSHVPRPPPREMSRSHRLQLAHCAAVEKEPTSLQEGEESVEGQGGRTRMAAERRGGRTRMAVRFFGSMPTMKSNRSRSAGRSGRDWLVRMTPRLRAAAVMRASASSPARLPHVHGC